MINREFMMMRKSILIILTLCMIAIFNSNIVQSQSLSKPALSDPGTYQTHVSKLLSNHCIACHGADLQEGDLRLDTHKADFSDSQSLATWVEVMDRMNLGEMPPADEPQPTPESAEIITDWIATEIQYASTLAKGTGGRELMRRLSRTEYANAVRDLLKVEFVSGEGPLDLLPPDGSLNGFDKVSKALMVDPSLMETYFDVAQVIADKAIQTGPPPVPTRRNRMEYETISGGIEYIKDSRTTIVTDDGIITMSQGMRSDEMLRHPWNNELIPVRGRYRLRVRLGADPKDREALYIRIHRSGEGDLYLGKVPGTLTEPEIIEIEQDFDVSGGKEIGIEFQDSPSFGTVNYHFTDLQRTSEKASAEGNSKLAGRIRAQMGAQGFPNQGRIEPDSRTTEHMPRIFFDWIELEGPLYDQWPPKSTETIFTRGLNESGFNLTYAHEIFKTLLPRAYRRPVQDVEIESILNVVNSELEYGETFPDAIKSGIVAMLCSPSFLLINELVPETNEREELDQYEIATRLSLFLWSSIPDDELFRKARNGKLESKEALLAEVQRMLANERSSALVNGFARQWLKADEFDKFAVDRNLYREYYQTSNAGLNEAVNQEPLEFFREILRKDKSLLNFLNSDWTMANETLARYYGIEGVTGNQFTSVSLPAESHRGGLTTMAAVHKWGSDGNRTKPVERGKYILDVLFNDPPKPPPPNVGEVEPNVQGELLTVRQRLDQHRTIAACASCHRKIDPYGLALENFNVIGQWRVKQDGERPWWPDEAKIDASGTLPNGTHFETVEEFRSALAEQEERFLRGLSEKLFTYALGRVVEPSDRQTIDELVSRVQNNDYTLRSLIEGIVVSEEFLTK
ncbi:DUF1592 domain-containing protein [uncultured Rubinisphaera sp.]|uniref:DUF1592 domain-containing protein n=1 Tax=uncultured Rubinisphaera sp. TaxID=1678686 RepID=UPI0030D97B6D